MQRELQDARVEARDPEPEAVVAAETPEEAHSRDNWTAFYLWLGGITLNFGPVLLYSAISGKSLGEILGSDTAINTFETASTRLACNEGHASNIVDIAGNNTLHATAITSTSGKVTTGKLGALATTKATGVSALTTAATATHTAGLAAAGFTSISAAFAASALLFAGLCALPRLIIRMQSDNKNRSYEERLTRNFLRLMGGLLGIGLGIVLAPYLFSATMASIALTVFFIASTALISSVLAIPAFKTIIGFF